MPVPLRPRRPLAAALTVVSSLLLLGACYGPEHPNSIFTSFTDWNRDVMFLFDVLIWLGMIVFVFVEALLIYTIWRYRQRPGQGKPEQVHGNTTLEILWTVIPAVVLVLIAVPTVQVIFRTQAKVKPGALQVEVIGHQWWWEFRYPEYTTTGANGKLDTLVTANELYLPIGRTVNFALKTQDVLHSFWIAPLAGKRDLISNHTNYLWFTPDSVHEGAFNGTCNEYCGASHANMKFRAYTVSQEHFESWVRNQLAPAVGAVAVAAPGTVPAPGPGATPGATPGAIPAAAPGAAPAATPGATPVAAATAPRLAPPTGATAPGQAPAVAQMPVSQATLMPSPIAGMQPDTASLRYRHFPREGLGPHNIPQTPIPPAVKLAGNVTGNAAAGAALFAQGQGACIGCHKVRGVPTAQGVIGPNLTHVGGRHTIAAGLFPNDLQHLAAWIKNARAMKPGVLMPALGKGQYDPVTKSTLSAGLTDQQAADIAAYLLTLK